MAKAIQKWHELDKVTQTSLRFFSDANNKSRSLRLLLRLKLTEADSHPPANAEKKLRIQGDLECL